MHLSRGKVVDVEAVHIAVVERVHTAAAAEDGLADTVADHIDHIDLPGLVRACERREISTLLPMSTLIVLLIRIVV